MSTENAKDNRDEMPLPEQNAAQAESAPEEREAEKGLEPLALYETGKLVPAIVGGCALAVLTLAIFREFGSWRQILAAALGLYLLYLFLSMVLRRNKPFTVISTEGLMFVRGKYKLPWKQIKAYEAADHTLMRVHTSTTINLYLTSDIDPKRFNIFGDRRVLFLRRRNIVEMRVIELDGFTTDQVILAMNKYRDACEDQAEEIQRGPRAKKRKAGKTINTED